MKQKKIIYKTNIFVRFANINNIYLVFYGYAKGIKTENDAITLKKIYYTFIESYPVDENLDLMHFITAYNRIDKMMIELRK
jgi:hypothetical protein